jgi:hypothetical protein
MLRQGQNGQTGDPLGLRLGHPWDFSDSFITEFCEVPQPADEEDHSYGGGVAPSLRATMPSLGERSGRGSVPCQPKIVRSY